MSEQTRPALRAISSTLFEDPNGAEEFSDSSDPTGTEIGTLIWSLGPF